MSNNIFQIFDEKKVSAQKPNRLKISEIFYSLQGESQTVGIPTVFIRLTGCPLRCQYCDTEYAFTGGDWMNFDDILANVKQYKTSFITVTGGEPLSQKNCLGLLKILCNKGYFVSLETSGAIDIKEVDQRVIKVVDLKTPGSNEVEKNLYENLDFLSEKDQLKFVICNHGDYEWAKAKLSEYNLSAKCEVLFSPSYGELKPEVLADWILEDQLPVRFQVQLHKYLWGDEPGH